MIDRLINKFCERYGLVFHGWVIPNQIGDFKFYQFSLEEITDALNKQLTFCELIEKKL